jgi:hypothetical protein
MQLKIGELSNRHKRKMLQTLNQHKKVRKNNNFKYDEKRSNFGFQNVPCIVSIHGFEVK